MEPCGWNVTSCGCGGCSADQKPATQQLALSLAVYTMWAATGRRYGPCEITVLPCRPDRVEPLYQVFPHVPGGGYDPFGASYGGGPVLRAGTWSNSCAGGCSCRNRCDVTLPGPVASVLEVLVDGAAVDPSAYRVYDRETLSRTDGDCWPSCQTYGEIPGFEVTYERGDEIPPPVLYATGILWCEYAKACAGDLDCALPANLRSLTRQGVEASVGPSDNQLAAPNGQIRTGIKLVDDIIAADNPFSQTSRPENSIWSPDMDTFRQITFQGGS